ncbi:alpha-1,3-mannosyl-glycoprotein 4-beta-N-acetylglucosaminyltransferase B-like isoform X2 [Lycorma delicatula]|uniref:alpha-1,3-mannosyl-glycoprotein 4-beta-N-acetylglucosaminyltransferase B-like isoform X2 n=1 Tax=Lycorma delicatula TaxID=130591 RepID=UPI003F50E224
MYSKMFRYVELPWLVQFFFVFYSDKPVDWSLDHMIYSKAYNLKKDSVACWRAKDELWVHCKPFLFQHIGTQSSLKGKVQKLKVIYLEVEMLSIYLIGFRGSTKNCSAI